MAAAAAATPTPPPDSTRHGRITPDNHGPYVVVAGYVMMCMMLLLVMTRLITKYVTIRALRLDDFTIVAAAVCIPCRKHLKYLLVGIDGG